MASRVSYGNVALTVIGGMPGSEIGVVTGMPGILGCVITAKKYNINFVRSIIAKINL